MKRRSFLQLSLLGAAGLAVPTFGVEAEPQTEAAFSLDPALAKDWLKRWQEHILGEEHHRSCDRETGEEIGWLVSPFLNGFYYGYRATGDTAWVDRLVDWTDSWIRRAVKEPDGYLGWPKAGTGGELARDYFTDSLLGEAMGFRPVMLMAAEVQNNPELKAKYGEKAAGYVKLAEDTFNKWIARGCWREVKNGGVWVVPAFGLDRDKGTWTEGYARREQDGLTHPANKQNHLARWLIAMHEATSKPVYRDHARKWWQVMRSRMRLREGGKYFVWDYWNPAGPWDYQPDGSTRHWVGVHPNGGYYQIDIEGITTAFEHELIFSRADIDILITTNRDFMWNHQVKGAKFRRIDGGEVDARWKESPGTLWTALVPYDAALRKVFEANNDPDAWGGLIATPWFLARQKTGKPV